jgi:hypothetical protein
MPDFLKPHESFWHPLLLLGWVAVSSFFFAKVEIQIEGEHGWAEKLPTWRIDKHWLLDLLMGGRPLTGYHAWMFSFMILVFHLPLFLFGDISWKLEARAVGCLFLFWIIEDFLWFVINPAYGLMKLLRRQVKWHKRYILMFPLDYWLFTAAGAVLIWYSFR